MRARHALSSRGVAWVAAGIATVVALASAWGWAGSTWGRLSTDYSVFADYSKEQRELLPSVHAGFAGELITFLAAWIEDDDRIYLQAPRTPYGTLDLHDTVGALVRYFLLPAVMVSELDDATVVVSYEADPAELGRDFVAQNQSGPHIFVSRLAYP